MRSRRDRSRPAPLSLTRLEDRLVPTGVIINPDPTDPPPATGPADDHGGLDTMPAQYFLSNPQGYLTGPQNGDANTLALQALAAYAAQMGLSPSDIVNPIVSDSYSDGAGQMSHVYLRQQLNGLQVVNGNIGAHFTAGGQLLTINGGFVPGIAALSTGTGAPPTPARSPVEAVAAAASFFGITLTSAPELTSTTTTVSQTSVVADLEASTELITANLVYVNTPGGARLGWEFVLSVPGGDHLYDTVVDATTGEVVFWADWTHSHAAYNALPLPNDSPQDGARQVVVNPADPTASPYGWHDTNGVAGAEYNDTRGNNVYAQADVFDTDASNIRPSGGAGLLFNNPINFAGAPASYRDALVTNLFYMNNRLHDIHYQYGFTEAAGNFQENTYGRGGTGGDAVQADAMDGSGTNNANFSTPPDGSFFKPRMQMYVFNVGTPNRDSDLDNGIITHEYGHGVSTRLTGGRFNSNSLNALQSGGMGEGWGDFWGLMFTQRAADAKNDKYGLANYSFFIASGDGLRQHPYSFDMSVNPMTFDDYGLGVGQDVEVHWSGALWASALWDMNWLLTDKYGFDADLMTGYTAGTSPGNGPGGAGNKLTLQLVMDALKIQPANPTFLDARDAILTADRNLTGGQNQREIWEAFARRGLGVGATILTSPFGNGANSTAIQTSYAVPTTSSSPAVVGQTPTGKVTGTAPASLTLTFSERLDTSTFSVAADVASFTGPGNVDLKPFITGTTWLAGGTQLQISFDLAAAAALVPTFQPQGQYKLVLAPDVLSADDGTMLDQDYDGIDGEPTEDAYTAYFAFDQVVLTATAASASGGVLATNDTIRVTFSEEVDPATLGTDDFYLSSGTVTGFTVVSAPGSPTVVDYTVTGMSGPRVYLTVPYGSVRDPFGFAVEGLNTSLPVVAPVNTAFPVPLAATGPLGWQSYEGFVSDRIGAFGEVDTYTLNIDAPTTLSLIADELGGLRSDVKIYDPSGALLMFGSSPTGGQGVIFPDIPVTVAGTYTLKIGGTANSTGTYRLHVLLGTHYEGEAIISGAINNTLIAAENVNPYLYDQGSGTRGVTLYGHLGSTLVQTLPPALVPDTADYYRVTITSAQTISIGLNRMSSGSLPTIQLVNALGVAVGTATTPTNYNQSVIFANAPAGTYYAVVSVPANPTSVYEYNLSVLAGGTMDAEGNNSIASALPVTLAGAARGGIAAGDEDWYSVTLASGLSRQIRITTETPGSGPGEFVNTLDPKVELYNSAGVLVGGTNTNDNGAADVRNALLVSDFLAPGTYYVRVLGANATTSGEYTLKVSDDSADPAPVGVSPGGPYTIAEGGQVTLAGLATDPNGGALTYQWYLNDVLLAGATGPTPTLLWSDLKAAFPALMDGPGVVTINVRVSDASATVVSAYTTLTITNTAPTATFTVRSTGTTALTVPEGSGFRDVWFTLPTDPSGVDQGVGFHYAFDFDYDGLTARFDSGDGTYAGSTASPIARVPASYFDDNRTLTVLGRIIDKDGGYSQYTVTFTIDNVAPTVTVSGGPFLENTPTSVSVALATEPSAADRTAGLRYSFDFGDNGTWDAGTDGLTYAGSSALGTVAVDPSFYPESGGTVTVRVRVFDKDGGTTDTVQTFAVGNAAPTGTVAVTGPAGAVLNGGTVPEGSTVTVSVGGVVDPSAGDTTAGIRYSYDLNYNGTTPNFTVGDGTYGGSAGVSATQDVPMGDGLSSPTPRKILVRLIDRDGGTTDTVFDLAVTNENPTGTLTAAASVTISSPVTVSWDTPGDPSAADVTAGLRYSFDFNNDGDFTDVGDVQNAASPSAPFTFNTPGPHVVNARIVDKDGGVRTGTVTVNVVNVAPTVAVSAPAAVDEGSQATVAVAATHPSSVTSGVGFRYAYDFGNDGTFEFGDGLSYLGGVDQSTATIPASLTADGNKTVTVRVVVFETNGLSTEKTATVVVQNVAPTATLTGPAGPVQIRAPLTFRFTGSSDNSPTDRAAGLRYSLDLNNDGDFTDPGESADSPSPVFQTSVTQTGSLTIRGRVTDKDGAFTDSLFPLAANTPTKTLFAAGVEAGNAPVAKLFDTSGNVAFDGMVFNGNATGGVRVATADVNGDLVPDLIAGTGPGSTAELKVIDGKTGATLFDVNPFGSFTGGIFVSAADVDGDGLADIAVSPDQGGGPRVLLYRGLGFTQALSFFGIDDPGFRGGARVALADVNGDGRADLLVSAGFGGGPRIAGYDGRTLLTGRQKLFSDFFAFDPSLRNGAYLAGGDLDGDGKAEVILGAGPGGGPQVIALSGAGLMSNRRVEKANFFAGNVNSRGGVRVTVADVDGDSISDIVTGEADGPHVTVYSGKKITGNGTPADPLDLLPFSAPMNGVYVG